MNRVIARINKVETRIDPVYDGSIVTVEFVVDNFYCKNSPIVKMLCDNFFKENGITEDLIVRMAMLIRMDTDG